MEKLLLCECKECLLVLVKEVSYILENGLEVSG